MQKLESIQALRAIAAATVAFAHCFTTLRTQLGDDFDAIIQIVGIGGAGVHVFFVVSGFIMVYCNAHHFGERAFMPVFLRRRLVRIYAPYWIVIAVNLPILYALGLLSHRSGTDLLEAVLLLPSNASTLLYVGWTLSYELYFYAIFCLMLMLPGWLTLYAMTAVFCALIGIGVLWPGPKGPFLLVATNSLLIEFVAGAWIAWAFLKGPRVPVGLAWAALAAGIAGFGVTLFIDRSQLPTVVTAGLPSALVVAGLVYLEAHGRALRFFSRLQRLGDASYSLYLLHAVLLPPLAVLTVEGMRFGLGTALLWTAVVFPLCLWLSILFSERVEHPAIRAVNQHLRRTPKAARTRS